MPDVETERLLNEIGQLLKTKAADSGRDTLLLAELDANYVAASVFEDYGDRIVYRDPDFRLTEALLDLWDAQEPGKRWREIEYLLHGDKFQAKFAYAEEIDSEDDTLDRRDQVVERHFGKKPVVYPPPPDDAMEYKV